MTDRLKGKVAVVTGAGSVGPGWGNGRSSAVLFAREGATVFLVDINPDHVRNTADTIREEGGQAFEHSADVTDSSAVKQMLHTCVDQLGRVDILVNNVGGSHPGGPIELSEEDWDSQLAYNLKTVFLGCKHVIPLMKNQGGGSIVNTASASGIRWTGSAQVAYAAAKAGVIQLTRVVAVQHAADGIRVNTVVPGQLHTPMVEARLARQRTGGNIESLLESRQKRTPIPFAGDGRDTANAALYLASDEARWVTGTQIVVDGGMTVRCD